MPFSSENGKWATDRVVNRLVPSLLRSLSKRDRVQILDIGVGCGTYKDRYGSVFHGDIAEWTGVEVWQPYVEKYRLDKKYENLYIMDVREWVNTNTENFNIAFVGDVLEHMQKEDAEDLIDYLTLKCDVVIIAIPIVHYPQPAFEGNPYEEHVKDDWSHKEVMETFPCIVDWACEQEIGVYFISQEKELMQWITKPRIGVYGICKNEEETISRALISVREADQILICDTGSTDGTLDLINTKKVDVHRINVMPWRFDEARNTAMMLTDPNLDILVSIDMDEYLPEGWYLTMFEEVQKHIRERGRPYDIYHHRFSTEWDWQSLEEGAKSKNFSSHWHSRIHTRHNWKWALPVHEILDYTGPGTKTECFLGGLTMYQRPMPKQSRGSYLPLLEISVRERPDVWKSWFFYADELLRAGRRNDAITALNTAIVQPDADKAHLYNALASYETDELKVLGYYIRACSIGNQREYWVYFARWCMSKNKIGLAKEAITNALKFTTPSSGYVYNSSCWNEDFNAYVQQVMGAV
jgi:glycosyltransferase involved in cell wall biosynthesis